MRNRNLLTMALAGALAAPAVATNIPHGRGGGGIDAWFRANGKLTKRAKRIVRSVASLQLRGYMERPCEAPAGYFWKQDANGHLWRLYMLPPTPGTRVYDQVFDRTNVRSGWGYVKPTYAPGFAV